MARRAAPILTRLRPRLLVDLALLALAFTLFAPNRASARPDPVPSDPAAACLAAGDRAADRHGVPRAVMRALTRTETGRSKGGALEPWAWTVNMEGAGHWFDSREQALAYVARERRRGALSFDVGCFQINHKWHGQHFESVEQMFDPAENADYAARFMRDLYDETRDWTKSAGYYHSRTPEFFNRYSARFAQILARGEDGAEPVRTAAVDDPGRRPADRDRRPAPALWRSAETPPETAGAIAIRVLRGGLGPLTTARGPLIGP